MFLKWARGTWLSFVAWLYFIMPFAMQGKAVYNRPTSYSRKLCILGCPFMNIFYHKTRKLFLANSLAIGACQVVDFVLRVPFIVFLWHSLLHVDATAKCNLFSHSNLVWSLDELQAATVISKCWCLLFQVNNIYQTVDERSGALNQRITALESQKDAAATDKSTEVLD